MQTSAMLVLEPIFEADLPKEQYAYRADRSALDAVQHVHKLINTGHVGRSLMRISAATLVRQAKLRRFQRVRDSRPGKGKEPPHRESSLGLMKVTT